MLHLRTLLLDGIITEKKFKNREIVDALKQNGSVKNAKRGVTVRYIELVKPENIFYFLKHHNYYIETLEDIDSYIEDMFDTKTLSREKIQHHTSDTKAKTSPSLFGLYVAPLEKIKIKLDDEVVELYPQKGVGHFLFHIQRIELFEDTIIVGVENYQVVWFAQNYREYFQDKKVLFVAKNSYMLQWIEEQTNEYIHFGDYYLAGVSIYLNTILPRLKKVKNASFFIPQNIEEFIKKRGNSSLFTKQVHYSNLKTSDNQLQELIEMIIKYKKGFEQEGLAKVVTPSF